ncbi:MAG: sodium:solute symporter family protein [Desulfurococcaceae archaeon]
MNSTIGLLDQVIFVVYLLALAAIGVLTTKYARTFEEYAVAGRRMKLWLAFSTVAATWIGGGITIGVAGRAYAGRFIGAWGVAIGFSLTLFLLGLFYAGPLRKLNLYTLADYYTTRFAKNWIGGLSAIIMFIAYVFAVTAQLTAGAVLLSAVFGWDLTVSVLVTGLIIIFYTYLGGLWAVALTDFLQLVITFIGILLAVGLATHTVGASKVAELVENSGMLDPGIPLAISFWALVVVLGLGDIPAPDLVQRVYASKDDGTAKLSCILAGFAYIAAGVVSMIVGLIMAHLKPGLEDPQMAYPVFIKTFLPMGMAGLTLSGLMAAVMSNADSMLLAPSIVLAKNLFKDILWKNWSERELLRASKLLVLVLGVISTAIALTRAEILYWLTLAFDVLFASLFVPLTLGLFWAKTTWQAAGASIIAGAASRLVLEVLFTAGYIVEWWIPSLLAPTVSLVVAIAVTLVTSE